MFDDARQAFERELNDAPFRVVSRQQVVDVLRLMRRPADTRLNATVAHEICLRDGRIRTFVQARVEKAGPAYVLSAELVDPDRDLVVASVNEEAPARGQVLGAARRLSIRLRGLAGDKLAAVARRNGPLVRVTTASLRALQLYTQGEAAMHRAEAAAAEQLFRQAIEHDGQFASAYISLAWAARYQAQAPVAYLAHAQQALELADTVSEREAYFIRGSYYEMTREPEQAIASYRALLELDPDHFWAANNVAYLLGGSRAVPYHLRAAALRPNDVLANVRAALRVAVQGHNVEAARAPIDRARGLLTPKSPGSTRCMPDTSSGGDSTSSGFVER